MLQEVLCIDGFHGFNDITLKEKNQRSFVYAQCVMPCGWWLDQITFTVFSKFLSQAHVLNCVLLHSQDPFHDFYPF